MAACVALCLPGSIPSFQPAPWFSLEVASIRGDDIGSIWSWEAVNQGPVPLSSQGPRQPSCFQALQLGYVT